MSKRKAETCYSLAKEWCANCRDGACLGAHTDGDIDVYELPEHVVARLKRGSRDGVPRFCEPMPKCLLSLKLPCRYFERCVLPIASRRREYSDVDMEYVTRITGWEERMEGVLGHPFLGRLAVKLRPEVRPCPDCGNALSPGKKLCEDCRKKRRQEADRKQKRRQRKKRGETCPTVY